MKENHFFWAAQSCDDERIDTTVHAALYKMNSKAGVIS